MPISSCRLRRSAPTRRRWTRTFVLDVDQLKVVNDTLGHAVGDAVLKVVVSCRTTQNLSLAINVSGVALREGGCG